MPISTKLCARHSSFLFEWRGDDTEIVKAQEPHDQFASNGTQSILGVKGIQVGLHTYYLLANFSQTWNKAFLGNGDLILSNEG